MGKQLNFVLREIVDKQAEDPEKDRTTYKFTPADPLYTDDVELRIKSAEALKLLTLPEKVKDAVLVEFGVQARQTTLEGKSENILTDK